MSNVLVAYQIDLGRCCELKKKNYRNFSKSDLSEKLLLGNIFFIDKRSGKAVFFNGELIKFFIEFRTELKALGLSWPQKAEIYSLFDTYHIEINRKDERELILILDKNKKHALTLNLKETKRALESMMRTLLQDTKQLYPDWEQIKNWGYIATHLGG